MTKENQEITKKIKRSIFRMEIISMIKIIIIITPIIIGIIYLPPLAKEFFNKYQNFFTGQVGGINVLETIIKNIPALNQKINTNQENIPPELLKMLKEK